VNYQFNEISPGWFPQVVLVNSAGSNESQGVVLRVQPDGSQTLIQKISAVAKTEFNLRRFPFDGQSLQAIFGVLGFDDSEVVLKVDSDSYSSTVSQIWIPEWTVTGISMSVQAAPYAGQPTASAFFTSIGVPFSVFWMDRSSLGDRINVSFIGILTAVAYQVVMSELLPRIAIVTWMNAFLNFSFLMMVGMVVVNLIVGALDQRGMSEVGDRIDRRCRWIFLSSIWAHFVRIRGSVPSLLVLTRRGDSAVPPYGR
jgi:Neurotransmitter-gated ion-channel ligand binding domain